MPVWFGIHVQRLRVLFKKYICIDVSGVSARLGVLVQILTGGVRVSSLLDISTLQAQWLNLAVSGVSVSLGPLF